MSNNNLLLPEHYTKPLPANTFKRHVLVDRIHNYVYVQIMYHGNGEHHPVELQDFAAGMWHKYVPEKEIEIFKNLEASGFQFIPVHLNWGKEKNDCYELEFCRQEDFKKYVLPFQK